MASLTAVSFLIYGVSDIRLVLLSFTTTLTCYNLTRLFKLSEYEKGFSPLSRWVVKHRFTTVSLTLVGGVLSVWLISAYDLVRLLLYIPIGFLALLYTLPLRIGGRSMQLRHFPGIKIFLIAVLWTLATVRIPLSLSGALPIQNLWITEISRFVFIIGITIPFDIRDLKYDSPKLRTIPQQVGKTKAKKIAKIHLLIFMLLQQLLFFFGDLSLRELISSYLIGLLAVFLVHFAGGKRGEWYYGFWIEGLSLMYFLFLSMSYLI